MTFKRKPNVSIEIPQKEDTAFLLRFVVDRVVSFSEELRFTSKEQEVLPFIRELKESLSSDEENVKIDVRGASFLKIAFERYAAFVRDNDGDPLDVIRVGYVLHEMNPVPFDLSGNQNISMEMLKGIEKKTALCYFTTSDYLSLIGLLVMLSSEEAFLSEYPSAKRKSFELRTLVASIQSSMKSRDRRRVVPLSNRERQELISVFEKVLEMENDPRMQAYKDEDGDIRGILMGISMRKDEAEK